MEFDFLLFPIRYNIKEKCLVLKFHYDCLKIGGFPNMPVIDIHLNLWFETLAACQIVLRKLWKVPILRLYPTLITPKLGWEALGDFFVSLLCFVVKLAPQVILMYS